MADPQQRRSPMPVSPLLADAAGWTWRLLVLGAGAYLLVDLLSRLYLLVLPFLTALFVAALVYPVVAFFRRRGLPRALATWLTVILGFAVLGGIGFYVADRAVAEYPQLVGQLSHVVNQARDFAVRHLHVSRHSVDNLHKSVVNLLDKHRKLVLNGVVSGVDIAGQVLAGAVLAFFIGFFLLYDGARIWGWVVGLFPATARERADGAGNRAWERLAGYVRGTFLVALFHGVVVGIALTVVGAPLVAPLALLVFLGSFIPIVGAVAFGGLAVIVAFATKGVVAGVVVMVVLLVDNQVEAHLLQPFLVGRYVRLHPLAVAVAITGGGLLQGVPGAVLAVPFVAVAYGVASYLSDSAPAPADGGPSGGGTAGTKPAPRRRRSSPAGGPSAR